MAALIKSFICMIISLFDLVSMCKMQNNPHFQTRSGRLIIVKLKYETFSYRPWQQKQDSTKLRATSMVEKDYHTSCDVST